MATQDTVKLGPPHVPKDESIKAFKELEHTLRTELIRLRRDCDKHEKEYFHLAAHLNDQEFASFTVANFEEVRIGYSAYGYHLFGRLRIPSLPVYGPCYVFFRLFDTGKEAEAKFHCYHTEEAIDKVNGGKKYRAIFTNYDRLEWFNE